MTAVNRVYHLRPKLGGVPQQFGGATVLVEGDTRYAQVAVKVSFCNPKDTFNKKLGRSTAAERTEKVIPLRGLPGFLGTTYQEVLRRARNVVSFDHEWPYNRNQFDNRVLDFLPKDLGA